VTLVTINRGGLPLTSAALCSAFWTRFFFESLDRRQDFFVCYICESERGCSGSTVRTAVYEKKRRESLSSLLSIYTLHIEPSCKLRADCCSGSFFPNLIVFSTRLFLGEKRDYDMYILDAPLIYLLISTYRTFYQSYKLAIRDTETLLTSPSYVVTRLGSVCRRPEIE